MKTTYNSGKFMLAVMFALFVMQPVGATAQSDAPEKRRTSIFPPGIDKEIYFNDRVKSMEETTWTAIDKFGEITKGGISWEHDHYIVNLNPEGNVVEEYTSDSMYLIGGKSIFKYDADGRLTERRFYAESDSTLWSVSTRIYDDAGNLTEEHDYEWHSYYNGPTPGGKERKTLNRYDAQNRLAERSEYDFDGKLSFKTIFKYNADGDLTETNRYFPDGKLAGTARYVYDAGRRLTEQSYTGGDGMLRSRSVKAYDSDGNLTETHDYSYYYNRSDDNNYLTSEEIIRYDAESGLVETRVIIDYSSSDGSLVNTQKETHEYTRRDSHGNWTERIIYNGEARIPSVITERIISYYE